ncbi:MAG: 2'-5' RNA ligase family protein [Firmicutes bacterium]|nr:2'-5' RNA ligase family protein [Bacillota bacterium]
MYLVSVYFDENTNRSIQKIMSDISSITGNTFMIDHNVPPHLTLAAMDAKKVEDLLPVVEELEGKLTSMEIYFVSIGAFFPYVLYMAPVMDYNLQSLQKTIYEQMEKAPYVRMNKYYQPGYWYPHSTLAKKLSKEEMLAGFAYCQSHFTPIKGRITKIGLAKVNPHEDVWTMNLNEESI